MDFIAYAGTALGLLAMIFRDPRMIMSVTLGCFAAWCLYLGLSGYWVLLAGSLVGLTRVVIGAFLSDRVLRAAVPWLILAAIVTAAPALVASDPALAPLAVLMIMATAIKVVAAEFRDRPIAFRMCLISSAALSTPYLAALGNVPLLIDLVVFASILVVTTTYHHGRELWTNQPFRKGIAERP